MKLREVSDLEQLYKEELVSRVPALGMQAFGDLQDLVLEVLETVVDVLLELDLVVLKVGLVVLECTKFTKFYKRSGGAEPLIR